MTIACYCGSVYTSSSDRAACPSCGVVVKLPTARNSEQIMSTVSYTPTPEPVDEQEGFAMLDGQARKRLKISGEEFLRNWDAGAYAGRDGDRPEVAAVAMLIPLVR